MLQLNIIFHNVKAIYSLQMFVFNITPEAIVGYHNVGS